MEAYTYWIVFLGEPQCWCSQAKFDSRLFNMRWSFLNTFNFDTRASVSMAPSNWNIYTEEVEQSYILVLLFVLFTDGTETQGVCIQSCLSVPGNAEYSGPISLWSISIYKLLDRKKISRRLIFVYPWLSFQCVCVCKLIQQMRKKVCCL